MSTNTRSWWKMGRSWVIALIVALLASLGLADGLGIDPRLEPAVAAMADATIEGNRAVTDRILDRVGFTLADQRHVAGWATLNPREKLATAARAFEDARPGGGAQQFLALLARDLSAQHATLKTVPEVAQLLVGDVPGLPPPSRRVSPVNLAAIDGSLHPVIDALSDSLGRGGNLPLRAVIEHVGYTPEQSLRIVQESVDPIDALRRAVVEAGDAKAQQQRVTDMANFVARQAPAAGKDVRLQPHLDPWASGPRGPRGPQRTVVPGRGGRGPGGGVTPAPQRRGLALGRESFPAGPRARTLPRRTTYQNGGMRLALRRATFARGIQGVAFGGSAVPARGTKTSGLSLDYVAGAPDGERVVVEMGRRTAHLAMPDWIVVPAAAWSAQDGVEVATAAGETMDSSSLPCPVFNYAGAIDGTLIALRLLQADTIGMVGFDYADLFQIDGQYLLGEGEVAPTDAEVAARTRSTEEIRARLDPFMYNTYVVTDAGVRYRFSVRGDRLEISGRPFVQLLRMPGGGLIDRLARSQDIERRVGALRGSALAKRAKQVATELRRVCAEIGCEAPGPDVDGLAPSTEADIDRLVATAVDGKRSLDDRREALSELEHDFARIGVHVVDAKDNPLANPAAVERLNPIVYRATASFAQAAAFFRYVRANHPAAWKAFADRLPAVSQTVPQVDLPTVMCSSP